MVTIAEEKFTARKLVHFEGFTLDLGKRALFRGMERVHLTARPLETLIFLVENRGRVAEKSEILDAIWKDTFVTEDVLVQAIKEIRRVLEDSKVDPRFIQTVPRQGYRFIGDVSVELPFSRSDLSGRDRLTVVPKNQPGKWRIWTIVTGLSCLLLISILAWFVWKKESTTVAATSPATDSNSVNGEQPLQHLATGEFPAGKPAISPDGKLILYVGSSRDVPGYSDIFVMPATGGNSVRVTRQATPSGDLPVFTSDSSHIVFSRPSGGEEQSRLLDLYIVPSSGGDIRPYLMEASGAGFSPDGRWVAYTKHLPSHHVLWLSSTDDLTQHIEIAASGYTPRWSPDGRWLAFTTSNPNGGDGDLWIVDAAGGSKPVNLTNHFQQLYGLTWTPDSRSIVFSSKRSGPHMLWKVSITDRKVEQVSTVIGESAAPSIPAAGNTMVFHVVHVTKDLMLSDDVSSSEAEQVTHDEYHQWLRLSPSGAKVASIVQRPDFGEHLYVTDLRTRESIRLSDSPAIHPSWLDDDNIAYLTREMGTNETTKVQVVNVSSAVTAPMTQFSGLAEWLAISPDKGKVAVVLISEDGKQRILVRDLLNGTDEVVKQDGQYCALRWLPGGNGLSWSGPAQASSPQSDGIWLYSLETRQSRRMISDGYGPVWDRAGTTFFYARTRDYSGLWKFDIKSGRSVKLRSWGEVSHFDVANDRLVYARGEGWGQIYSIELRQ